MRDISTITPKESAGLWDAVMPEHALKPFRGNAYHLKATDTAPERICLWSGVDRLGIYFSGRVWADCDLTLIDLDQERVLEYLEGIGIQITPPPPPKNPENAG
jgi:hypothetical protein